MDVFELVWRVESAPTYQKLERANLDILNRFLESVIGVAVELEQPIISTAIIKSFNSHAIACLHSTAGEYRRHPVQVGKHKPEEYGGRLPAHWRVPALMDDFVNTVNRRWTEQKDIELAAYVLWRLNFIHPFENGNGRTARALCYYVLCVKYGGLLPGKVPLPTLIKKHRDVHVQLLQKADDDYIKNRKEDMSGLIDFLSELAVIQLNSSREQ